MYTPNPSGSAHTASSCWQNPKQNTHPPNQFYQHRYEHWEGKFKKAKGPEPRPLRPPGTAPLQLTRHPQSAAGGCVPEAAAALPSPPRPGARDSRALPGTASGQRGRGSATEPDPASGCPRSPPGRRPRPRHSRIRVLKATTPRSPCRKMPNLSMRAPFSQPRSPGPGAPAGRGVPAVRPRLPLGGGAPMARPGRRPQRRMAAVPAPLPLRPAACAACPPRSRPAPAPPLPAPPRHRTALGP